MISPAPTGRLHARIGPVLISLFVTAGSPAIAAPNNAALMWLTKAFSGATAPYDGIQSTIVFSETGSSETRVRVRGDGRGNELREFTGGPATGASLLLVKGRRYQRSASGSTVRLPEIVEGSPAERAALIVANYHVSLDASQRVLGRRATTVTVKAARPSNPSRTMVIDAATGLILEDKLHAPDGKERSSTRFIQIRFGPQPAALFDEPRVNGAEGQGFGPSSFAARSSEQSVLAETGRAVPRPAYVPEGFRVSTYGVMRTGSGRRTPAVRYSDGLAAFSIFTRGAQPRPGMGPRGRGRGRGPGPHGFGREGGGSDVPGRITTQADRQQAVVTFTSGTASYILFGDIAADELARVARSLP